MFQIRNKQAPRLMPRRPRDTEVLAMSYRSPSAGSRFREARKSLGLTLRDVARKSAAIAREEGDDRFRLSSTNLHWIETKGRVPSLYRLYSLARIHRLGLETVLNWYLENRGSVDSQTR